MLYYSSSTVPPPRVWKASLTLVKLQRSACTVEVLRSSTTACAQSRTPQRRRSSVALLRTMTALLARVRFVESISQSSSVQWPPMTLTAWRGLR